MRRVPPPKRDAPKDGEDFYPTPAWATYALIENETFTGEIHECACGDGRMAEVLKETGQSVFASDLCNRGYGETGINFLKSLRPTSNIVTNPPFNLAQEFIEHALTMIDHKAAFLLRLAFLESQVRAKTLFRDNPPSRVWVFSERITFYPGGEDGSGSGATAHAWFVWDKQATNKRTELCWIEPGYKSGELPVRLGLSTLDLFAEA